MENIIIIAIIVIVGGFALKSTLGHFKGQGGCCGGGSYKHKSKHMKNVQYQKTFHVEGMHCEGCKNRIEEAVDDIDGVAGKVDLKKGTLTVSYASDVEDQQIINKVTRAGYTITAS